MAEAALSELRSAIIERLGAIDSSVRSTLAQFAEATKLATRSIETNSDELRSIQDSLGRHVSALEIFQARLDVALATIQDSRRQPVSVRGGDRSLMIFVSVLAVVSTASLIVGLISVFG